MHNSLVNDLRPLAHPAAHPHAAVDLSGVPRVARLHLHEQAEAVARRVDAVCPLGILERLEDLAGAGPEAAGPDLDAGQYRIINMPVRGWKPERKERKQDSQRRFLVVRLEEVHGLHPDDVRLGVDDLRVLAAGLIVYLSVSLTDPLNAVIRSSRTTLGQYSRRRTTHENGARSPFRCPVAAREGDPVAHAARRHRAHGHLGVQVDRHLEVVAVARGRQLEVRVRRPFDLVLLLGS